MKYLALKCYDEGCSCLRLKDETERHGCDGLAGSAAEPVRDMVLEEIAKGEPRYLPIFAGCISIKQKQTGR